MTLSLFFGLGLCILVGVSLGLFGGGGAILAIPILVYIVGIAAKTAVAMALAIVAFTSLFASLMHYQRRSVHLPTGLLFAAFGMGGAYVGAKGTYLFPDVILLILFAILMLVVGTIMFFRRPRREEDDLQRAPLSGERLFKMGIIAFFVGVLTGFLGTGGGFLIVPALALFAGLPMRLAVGTSLLVITMNSTTGFIGHLGEEDLPWGLTLGFALFAVLGAGVGTWLAHRFSPIALRKGFAVLIILVGATMFIRNVFLWVAEGGSHVF